MSELRNRQTATQFPFAEDSYLQSLDAALHSLEPSLIATLRDLVGTPSQNIPPSGEEAECQRKVASALSSLGWKPDVYEPTAVLLSQRIPSSGRAVRTSIARMSVPAKQVRVGDVRSFSPGTLTQCRSIRRWRGRDLPWGKISKMAASMGAALGI